MTKMFLAQVTVLKVPYSGETFEGENVCEFRGFVAICKRFPRNLGTCCLLVAPVSNLRKFSPQNFSSQFEKVSPSKVSHYMIIFL